MRLPALFSVAIVLVCAAAGYGAFKLGREGGPSLTAAQRVGGVAGQQAGTRAGDAAGHRAGYAAGYRAGYRHVYLHAYRVAYRRALN